MAGSLPEDSSGAEGLVDSHCKVVAPQQMKNGGTHNGLCPIAVLAERVSQRSAFKIVAGLQRVDEFRVETLSIAESRQKADGLDSVAGGSLHTS